MAVCKRMYYLSLWSLMDGLPSLFAMRLIITAAHNLWKTPIVNPNAGPRSASPRWRAARREWLFSLRLPQNQQKLEPALIELTQCGRVWHPPSPYGRETQLQLSRGWQNLTFNPALNGNRLRSHQAWPWARGQHRPPCPWRMPAPGEQRYEGRARCSAAPPPAWLSARSPVSGQARFGPCRRP